MTHDRCKICQKLVRNAWYVLAVWRPRSCEEEDSRTLRCHSLKSGGIFDTLVKVWFFQTCGRSGKLWRPVGSTWRSFLGQHQAAGIYLKSCLGPLPCLGEALSIEQPPEESLWSFPEGTPILPPLLPKTNLTIQGWLTADSSSPFPIANLTLSDP